MGERKNFADHLGPAWHTAKRKHESGEQNRREKDEESHLYRLQLVFRDGGEGDSHRQICDDEHERDQQQKKNTALHRYMKKKVGRDQNDRYLDIADENVRNYFSNEDFAR